MIAIPYFYLFCCLNLQFKIVGLSVRQINLHPLVLSRFWACCHFSKRRALKGMRNQQQHVMLNIKVKGQCNSGASVLTTPSELIYHQYVQSYADDSLQEHFEPQYFSTSQCSQMQWLKCCHRGQPTLPSEPSDTDKGSDFHVCGHGLVFAERSKHSHLV